jgi:hypothetical protein
LLKPPDPAFAVQPVPASHRIVIEIESLGYPLAVPAVIQKQHGIRPARDPVLRQATADLRNQLLPFLGA